MSAPRFNARLSHLGTPLLPIPSNPSLHPSPGFFRNNYCDSTPLDRASHTVAALVTPEFLAFSKSMGNDLSSLFPSLSLSSASATSSSSSANEQMTESSCTWCLCASRWHEAFLAAKTHPMGEKIVPKVFLESTHQRARADVGIEEGVLERFAVQRETGKGKDKAEGAGRAREEL